MLTKKTIRTALLAVASVAAVATMAPTNASAHGGFGFGPGHGPVIGHGGFGGFRDPGFGREHFGWGGYHFGWGGYHYGYYPWGGYRWGYYPWGGYRWGYGYGYPSRPCPYGFLHNTLGQCVPAQGIHPL